MRTLNNPQSSQVGFYIIRPVKSCGYCGYNICLVKWHTCSKCGSSSWPNHKWTMCQRFFHSQVRDLSQITFAFFGNFWPCTSLVCTFYEVNYTFSWPPTHPKCKRNFWKVPNQIYLVTMRPTQLTQASFFTKKSNVAKWFLITVTLRWHSGVENNEIWTFSQFSMSKNFRIFLKKIFIEEYQFRTTFFVKYIFENFKIEQLLFLKWRLKPCPSSH